MSSPNTPPPAGATSATRTPLPPAAATLGPPGPSRVVDRPGRLVVAAAIGGLALDLGLRGGVANLAVTLGVATAVVVVLTRPELDRTTRFVVAAALVPAAFLSVWASPWLATTNVLAILGLGVLGVSHARVGVADTTVGHAVERVVRAGWFGLGGLVPLARGVPLPSSTTVRAVGRTGRAVIVALPLTVALVALLVSADAVFGRMVALPEVDLGPLPGHLLLWGVSAVLLVVVGLATGAEGASRRERGWFSAGEVAVVLGFAAAVLALFVVSQLLAVTSAGQRLVQEAGLTPAGYARQGFFQLCWASVLVVAWVALARWLATPGAFATRTVRRLASAVPLLAVGLVAVSLRRMALYDRAFGLTMLRLAVVVAAIWIGVVLVLVALRNLGMGPHRDWVVGASVVAAFILVVGVNLVNPEAFVVRHNVARAAAGAEVDVAYLSNLSTDAVPALEATADATGYLDLQRRLELAMSCAREAHGVTRLNLSEVVARRTLEAHCP